MQYQSNQTNPQPTPEDTAQNASTPASQEAAKSQQKSEWKQKIQTLLKKCTIPFVIVGALFLIVGVPIIINELYKRPGYVTMWSAADMLGYYGTILGATIAVTTIATTIWTTQKQIQIESYIRAENEKWKKLEYDIDIVISELNPSSLLGRIDETMCSNDDDKTNDVLLLLHKYQAGCRKAILLGSTNNIEVRKKQLIKINGMLVKTALNYMSIAQNGINAYENLRDISIAGVRNKELKKKVNDLVREFQINMVAEATDSYFKIKAAKEETFRKIYTDIQKEADSILSPWRKH